MSDVKRNPNDPISQRFESRDSDTADYPTEIAGPGGRTNNIENNERGILDDIVFRAMATYRQAELGSDHDSHTQGIYRESGDKYSD